MAELSAQDRQRVTAGLMRHWSRVWEPVTPIASVLRAAVDATDAWIDANQASYNSALPAEAQTGLSFAQKTLLFVAVAAMRVDVGFARRLFGEVD